MRKRTKARAACYSKRLSEKRTIAMGASAISISCVSKMSRWRLVDPVKFVSALCIATLAITIAALWRL